MGQSVENVYIQTYEATVRHLAQQGVTRLLPWTMQKSVQSEAHNWERLGVQEAVEKTGRLVDTPEQDYPFSRRVSIPTPFHTGDTTEQEDIAQLLIDPNSNIAQAQGKAMRRAQDDRIIEACVGDSRDGDGNAIPFDVTQNVGDGTAAINFDIVTETTEKFMENDIDPDEEKVFVVSPRQARKLLQLTEATSGDYNAVRPLTAKGYIESWMGYSWVVSTRLQSPATDQEYCFAMTRKAIGVQMNKDVWVRVAEDPTKSFAWRIYAADLCGAIRVEDEHLVRLTLSTVI